MNVKKDKILFRSFFMNLIDFHGISVFIITFSPLSADITRGQNTFNGFKIIKLAHQFALDLLQCSEIRKTMRNLTRLGKDGILLFGVFVLALVTCREISSILEQNTKNVNGE